MCMRLAAMDDFATRSGPIIAVRHGLQSPCVNVNAHLEGPSKCKHQLEGEKSCLELLNRELLWVRLMVSIKLPNVLRIAEKV